MTCLVKTDFCEKQADTWTTHEINVTDDAGVAIDITGFVFYFTLKDSINQSYADAIFKKQWTAHINPAAGETLFSMSALETATIPAGRYIYDIQWVTPTNNIKTILEGDFVVTPDVTNPIA